MGWIDLFSVGLALVSGDAVAIVPGGLLPIA
jgi:hypothetical protein